MSSHIPDPAMPSQASESPAIFTLPNEIIGEVINLLSVFEVSRLRLTCKKLADLGVKKIFEAVRFLAFSSTNNGSVKLKFRFAFLHFRRTSTLS